METLLWTLWKCQIVCRICLAYHCRNYFVNYFTAADDGSSEVKVRRGAKYREQAVWLWQWLGPPMMTVQYAMFFQLCGRHCVFSCGPGGIPPPYSSASPLPPFYSVSFTFLFFHFLLALSIFLLVPSLPFYHNSTTPFPGQMS